MRPVGFYNIFTYYDLGITYLKEILQQDVYKIEPRNTKGHRKHNVVVHKLISQLVPLKKELKEDQQKNNILQNNQIENNNNTTNKLYEQTGIKCQCRVTNNNEKIFLKELLKFDIFSEDKTIKMLEKI
ncbi:1988_t:CDS:1 [Cetraspora pellucida]|uniref:1988_t:CDS:1 n=1 Tax=Cetraspora pellucida TaxID=1433469 RepID=A0A9N9IZ81_9GLOM|nr:1988_t:CDS:1 [Cetraspora pellucida]